MAHLLDPEGVMETLRDGTVKAISQFFPVVGKKHTLVLRGIEEKSPKNIDDVTSQRQARMMGRTWATGLYGNFELVDNDTKKVIDRKSIKVLNLPHITRRYSYIVDGTEYQVDNQWRLKSGVYTRERADGDLETQFNMSKGRGFRMAFDPAKKNFKLQYGTSNIPLLPVLRALGVSDDDLKDKWGADILASAEKQSGKNSAQRLAKILSPRSQPKDEEDAAAILKDVYDQTELRGDTTKLTLGKEFTKVGGDTLLAASSKLLNVHRGTDETDHRDALQFKELWSVEDFIPERITNSKRRIERRIRNNVDRKTSIRSIVSSDVFNLPVKTFFTSTNLAQQPSQVNPLDFIGGHLRTTLLGPGGISTENAVSFDAKLIDPSHLGFLDPVATPEGPRTGITLHLGLDVNKQGKEAAITVYDTKLGKKVSKTPPELAGKTIAFPDQYTWKDGTPKPKSKTVTAASPEGDPRLSPASSVDFILPSSKGMFTMTTNLIPFLASDQANRAEMATRHLEQSISLKNREAPLVQTHTGNVTKQGKETWEQVVGRFVVQKAPVSGTVASVSPDAIKVRDNAGKLHTVPLYDNYPLNDVKSFIGSTPLVKKGDQVKRGQTITDTNFTKDGVLALGTNLRIAYLPYKGLVFEDGIVISESAAEKLTSEHLHKARNYVDKNMTTGLKKFRAHYPGVVTDANAKKLDEDGIIKKGETVNPGEVITTILQKTEPSKEQLLVKGIHRSLIRPFKDKSEVWEKGTPGVVTDVIKNGREVTVYIKTEEKADIGDKLSGRHGNKGVITAVIPDEEMPKNKDGEAIQIIVNPSGVPGRINPGQVLETQLANVAKKTGQHYAVSNFEPDDDKKVVHVKGHYRTVQTKEGPKQVYIEPYKYDRGYQEIVQEELKKHNVSDTEELFDPETGKSLGQVLVGQQYVLKQVHTIDKKLNARAHGYGYDYDASMIPRRGGKSGPQRFGGLGLFAMLAHGATANIRDALTYKSDKTQDDVWTAVQTGQRLPAPKPSFAYEKFLGYLNALGVNVEKEGSGLILSPLTDKEILDISNGELPSPTRVLRGKDLKPEEGGLFDEEITGGPGGSNWSHISLVERIPNPMFEKAAQSLLGLKVKEFDGIINGTLGYSKDGQVVPAEEAATVGPKAIVEALGKINVKEDLAKNEKALKTARASELNKYNKRVKYLSMLDRTGLSPQEAYTLKNLPVLPPIFRPISIMEGGDLNIDGLNMLYRETALLNDKLKEAKTLLPADELAKPTADLYDALGALMATGAAKDDAVMADGQMRPPGILTILSGKTSPKHGYFQKKVIDRKQDVSMRSVIVPDLDLHLDEVGLPRKGAMKIFQPFVVKEMNRMGLTPLQAREEIDKDSKLANKALEVTVGKRPILFKRDPVLHKFGIMGFKVKLHEGKSVKIHPLVVGGFNADFDGDTMAVFVPVSQEAVDEAYKLMPSKNLFNPATGRTMYQPSLEGQLGLFLLTQMGKAKKETFPTLDEALSAARKGKISMTDVVTADGKKTTAGRIAFYKTLPPSVRTDNYLTDKKMVMDGKNLQAALRSVAKKAPGSFQPTADKIKNLGFGHAYNIGFSFKAEDFNTLKGIRNKHLDIARKKLDELPKGLSAAERDKRLVDIYAKATKDMSADAKKKLSTSGNSLYSMYSAGVKPGWAQLQQLILAPMLLQNAKNEIIPVPVTKSYSEGLGTADYWVASSGARKGLIEKVQSVSKPGALSKQIMNTMLPYTVTEDNCGTTKGIALALSDRDLVDRFTAKPIPLSKGRTVPAGSLVTAEMLSDFAANKVSKVVVRSPLKCQSPKGLCGTCYGTFTEGKKPAKGTNIGAIAGQAVGERGTQLSMKQFHMGGVVGAGGGGNVVSSLDRITQLLKMPAKLPGSANLSPATAKITAIAKSSAGGHDVTVGTKKLYVPASKALQVKVGEAVKKGQRLTDGPINPRELLELTNMDTVQRYISDEIHKVYESEGVRRRNVEVVTKALTNLGVVDDPGDLEGYDRGDFVSLSSAAKLNSAAKVPMKLSPVLRGIETLALDQTTDWLARLQYRKLKETFIQGASQGWKSDIHSTHPVPGIVYSAEFGVKDKTKGGPY